MTRPRFVFITGGVSSSLGKGIAAAALAALLQAHGYVVRIRKLDPYLNIDPGTMNPREHGEVFVTTDGAETDLDLGHYERFTGIRATAKDSISAGKIYSTILRNERQGDHYLGKTVQVIPHVTDAIKDFITSQLEAVDVVICEIGGTVGDIEGLPFLEAIRQLRNSLGRARSTIIHTTLLPYLDAAGELKTKPTQHSVKVLLSVGIQPDILLCRSEKPIPQAQIDKLSLFCNVFAQDVIPALDVATVYQVPLTYARAHLAQRVLAHLELTESDQAADNLKRWEEIVPRYTKNHAKKVKLAVVGKYCETVDAYKSIAEAIQHASTEQGITADVAWINAIDMDHRDDAQIAKELAPYSGILIPGGFGKRGIGGKMASIRFAREHHVPFFGICLGMQLAVLEFARHVAGIADAASEEFSQDERTPKLVVTLENWLKGAKLEVRAFQTDGLGGTMRLGQYPCVLRGHSRVAQIYGQKQIAERHRHRYEIATQYAPALERFGLQVVGDSVEGIPEIIELESHPWFVGVQFHPEFESSPFCPHPLFTSWIVAALQKSDAPTTI